MLAKARKNRARNQGLTSGGGSPPLCQFFWHRPLGASEHCRRLTVQLLQASFQKKETALWALPLTLDQLVVEIQTSPCRLDALELDGTSEAWQAFGEASVWEKEICPLLYQRRRHLRRLVFYGGVADAQRSLLLRQLTETAVVEIYDGRTCLDETLQSLQQPGCSHLAELRLLACAPLSTDQVDVLIQLMQRGLASFVLRGTAFDDPCVSARRFFLAVEESSLEEVAYEPLEDQGKAYLSLLTKLHRMRHYYLAKRAQTDLPSYSIADDALGVVQSWWRSTHRPAMVPDVKTRLEGCLDDGSTLASAVLPTTLVTGNNAMSC
jgi:hypothetical protein